MISLDFVSTGMRIGLHFNLWTELGRTTLGSVVQSLLASTWPHELPTTF